MKVAVEWKEMIVKLPEGLIVDVEKALPVFEREMGFPLTHAQFIGWCVATASTTQGEVVECWVFDAAHMLHHCIQLDAGRTCH